MAALSNATDGGYLSSIPGFESTQREKKCPQCGKMFAVVGVVGKSHCSAECCKLSRAKK